MIGDADLLFTYEGPHDGGCESWVDQKYQDELGFRTVASHVRDYVRIIRRNTLRMMYQFLKNICGDLECHQETNCCYSRVEEFVLVPRPYKTVDELDNSDVYIRNDTSRIVDRLSEIREMRCVVTTGGRAVYRRSSRGAMLITLCYIHVGKADQDARH